MGVVCRFSRKGEHEVFFQRRTQSYLKATRLEKHKGYGIALGSLTHGATPSEYFDRLLLQNEIFHDDIRLERIVENDGKPIIVTSQPAIKGNAPTQAAPDELMLEKGYEKLAEGAYYDEDPRNAIQAADGHIYPIEDHAGVWAVSATGALYYQFAAVSGPEFIWRVRSRVQRLTQSHVPNRTVVQKVCSDPKQ